MNKSFHIIATTAKKKLFKMREKKGKLDDRKLTFYISFINNRSQKNNNQILAVNSLCITIYTNVVSLLFNFCAFVYVCVHVCGEEGILFYKFFLVINS